MEQSETAAGHTSDTTQRRKRGPFKWRHTVTKHLRTTCQWVTWYQIARRTHNPFAHFQQETWVYCFPQ